MAELSGWLVAFLQGNSEFEFKQWMLKRGAVVYFPVVSSVWRPRYVKQPVKRDRPVFGNYVFVQNDGKVPWPTMAIAPGFCRIVVMEGEALIAPDSLIEELQRRELAGDFRAPVNQNEPPRIGQFWVVKEGPMEGICGKIIAVSKNSQNAELEVDHLWRRMKISVSNLMKKGEKDDFTRVGRSVCTRARASIGPTSNG